MIRTIVAGFSAKHALIALSALVLALALSVWGNVHQHRTAIAKQAAAEALTEALQARAATAAALASLAYSRGFANAAADEATRVSNRAAEIDAEQQRIVDRYQRLLQRIPPLNPVCVPGQARVQAFNDWSD